MAGSFGFLKFGHAVRRGLAGDSALGFSLCFLFFSHFFLTPFFLNEGRFLAGRYASFFQPGGGACSSLMFFFLVSPFFSDYFHMASWRVPFFLRV